MNPPNSTSTSSTHGDVLTAISDGMVALLKEFYGRGPTRAKSVLDLRELTFLGAAGVHAIVDASIGARRDGRRLLLVGAPAWVQRVFALTGTSHLLDVVDWDPEELPARAFLQLARRSIAA